MSVLVQYRLLGAGSAECYVEVNDQSALITVVFLDNALGSLLQAMINLVNGLPVAEALFMEEPGEFRWLFESVPADKLHIKILCFRDYWQPLDRGTVVFDATCRLRTFAGAVLATSQLLLREHGQEGYKSLWKSHEFPIVLHDRLKIALQSTRKSSQPKLEAK